MCLSLSLCVHVSQSVLWLWPSSWRRAVNSSKSCVAVALIWTSGPGTASRLCTERFSAGTALHSLWGYNVVFCGLNWPQGGSSRQAAPLCPCERKIAHFFGEDWIGKRSCNKIKQWTHTLDKGCPIGGRSGSTSRSQTITGRSWKNKIKK